YKFALSLNISEIIRLEGRVVRGKRESIYQYSGTIIRAESLRDRWIFNRFLSDRIPAHRWRLRTFAFGTGALVVFLATKIMALSLMSASGIGAAIAIAMLVFPLF